MPIHVMYLDDERELCEIFSETFSSNDVAITTFAEANQAIDFSKENSLDVIFVDYRLVGTTGDLAALAMPSDIPKYLITGEAKVTPTYNFKNILSKPYDYDLITEVLQSFISKKSF